MTKTSDQTKDKFKRRMPVKNGKRILTLLAFFILMVSILGVYFANASRFPDAIDMSSTHSHRGNTSNGAERISIETLRLVQSSAPLKTYTLTAKSSSDRAYPTSTALMVRFQGQNYA